LIIRFYLLFTTKIAHQWEEAMVLHLGRIDGLKGPYLFWIMQIIDSTPMWIGHWVKVTPFSAKKFLTKDTMPVDTMNPGGMMGMASFG
jgi:hypothetical protein